MRLMCKTVMPCITALLMAGCAGPVPKEAESRSGAKSKTDIQTRGVAETAARIDTTLLAGYWKPVSAPGEPQRTDGNIFLYKNGRHTLYFKSQAEMRVVYTGRYNFSAPENILNKVYTFGGTEITAKTAVLRLTADTLILKGVGEDALPGEKVFFKIKMP